MRWGEALSVPEPGIVQNATVGCRLLRAGERISGWRIACRLLLAVVATVAIRAPAQAPPEAGGVEAYTVVLESPSVGERLRSSGSKSAGGSPPRRDAASLDILRRAVASTQDDMLRAIEAHGVEVTGATQYLVNAVFVRAIAEQAAVLESLPGVRAVTRARRYEPMLGTAAEIVKVAAARMRPAGTRLLGEGMKIAIIDSGLDFDHEAFRDPALPALAGYPRGDSRYLSYASNKVVAVRSYVEMLTSSAAETSTPDDHSPVDLSGHGTGVAMAAAGASVETPLGTVSGIAPKARIGVYKVFGTPGLNSFTVDQAVMAALDDAIADGMDVLNLSLGNLEFDPWDETGRPCGQPPGVQCDPLAVAAHAAVVDFDRVVVVAAGNNALNGSHEFPLLTSLNSPSNVPSVIAVGAVGNSVLVRESVQVRGHTFTALTGTGPRPAGPLSGPVSMADSFGDGKGCEPYPEGALAGTLLLVDRGDCFFRDKVELADTAGASGVLVTNHEGDDLVEMALLEQTDIPAYFVGQTDGGSLRQLLSVAGSTLTLDPTPVTSDRTWQRVSAASSRGPTLLAYPKPDIAAPGLDVYTADPRYNGQGVLFTPSGFRQQSGTSIAAPVVSGAAALVWQASPSLTARQVSSLLINSADPDSVEEEDEPARIASVGAGVLDIEAALQAVATAVPSSIGFGSVGSSPFPVRREIVVTNVSSQTRVFRASFEPRDLDTRGRLRINGRRLRDFSLGPGGSTMLAVTLDGSRPQPGSYEGRMRISAMDGSGDILVPYLYLVSDNVPYNAYPLRGGFSSGLEGEIAHRSLVARVIDRFGLPIQGQPFSFRVTQGAGTVTKLAQVTGPTGILFASARFTGDTELQQVVATVGDLEIPFEFQAGGTVPAVLSIDNAASGSSPGGVAPGALVTIAGSGFARYPSGPFEGPQTRRFPVTRKGATVAFDAPAIDVSVAGRIYAIGEDWVTVQLPWTLGRARSALVKVRSGMVTEPFDFGVVAADPGIFHFESGEAAFAAALHPDGRMVTAETPAAAGGEVTLTMTGNGPVPNPPRNGEVAYFVRETALDPEVSVGGLPATVRLSALDTELAGLYLLTFEVPQGLAPGDHTVSVRIGDASSNEALLPVR